MHNWYSYAQPIQLCQSRWTSSRNCFDYGQVNSGIVWSSLLCMLCNTSTCCACVCTASCLHAMQQMFMLSLSILLANGHCGSVSIKHVPVMLLLLEFRLSLQVVCAMQVFVYYKAMSKAVCRRLFSTPAEVARHAQNQDPSQFISAVCWKPESQVLLSANSQGTIKVMQVTS